ncbi:DUF3334 family protein [Desulfobotulus mexicanus]|uniref:DUF3334 family protein n=1 Tax=Desulfobotulus mexicanus TaxID=2586642 RepID=A0A5Q4VDP8_9BACT|nr:DUF3334 family protein [Desulfobotulus mexicanus]TYT75755.1 DUF3334 family protein [Desulfobotulus mexicanus]
MDTEKNLSTIDQIALILCKATRHVLESSTKLPIKYSTTFQEIPKVTMKPEIGCFVQFTGDYNGLVVMNFSAGASMELYSKYMTRMGIPEDELARDYTSNEVADSIGEMTNQIMGLLMRTVEDKFQLSSFCGQPKALALNSAITLILDCDYRDNRRMVFHVDGKKFHIELALEKTEFIQT